jgi:uncharacterized protein YqgC (DUF456 family)
VTLAPAFELRYYEVFVDRGAAYSPVYFPISKEAPPASIVGSVLGWFILQSISGWAESIFFTPVFCVLCELCKLLLVGFGSRVLWPAVKSQLYRNMRS